jgi:hypothetical protein
MDDAPAQAVAPAGRRLNQQRSAALDERERRLDRREAQIARRERANDLRDLAAHRDDVNEDLYPAMDD